MGNDEARVDLAVFDQLKKRFGVSLDVGLAGSDCEALIHCSAKRDLIAHSDVDAGDGNGASLPAAHDRRLDLGSELGS